MGHNRKNANRGEAIAKNTARAETLRKAIQETRKNVRDLRLDGKIQRLALEKRLLDEIEIIVVALDSLDADFEAHRVPWYRKTAEWIRARLRPSGGEPALPEPPELDEDDEMENPTPERILERLEYRLKGAKADAVTILENDALPASEQNELMDRAIGLVEDIQGKIDRQKLVVAGVIKPPPSPHYLGAIEIDADKQNLDPELGEPIAVDVELDQAPE